MDEDVLEEICEYFDHLKRSLFARVAVRFVTWLSGDLDLVVRVFAEGVYDETKEKHPEMRVRLRDVEAVARVTIEAILDGRCGA